MNAAELRSDGWWLRFDQGEEAGPFRSMTDAQEFLDYVDELQRDLKTPPAPPAPGALPPAHWPTHKFVS